MIQLRTILKPADNSGAKRIMVIGISPKIGKVASLGDVVRGVVDRADPNGAVSDSEKVKILIESKNLSILDSFWVFKSISFNK